MKYPLFKTPQQQACTMELLLVCSSEEVSVEVEGDTSIGDVRDLVQELFALEYVPILYLDGTLLEVDEDTELHTLDVSSGSRVTVDIPLSLQAQQTLAQYNLDPDCYAELLASDAPSALCFSASEATPHTLRTLVLQTGTVPAETVFTLVHDDTLLREYLSNEAPRGSESMLGETPLVTAMDVGNTLAARLLVEYGADVCRATEVTETTPLAKAAIEDCAEMCALLVANGARVDAKCCPLGPPLYVAAHFTSQTACEMLVSKGANLNKTGSKGDTPLMAATQAKHTKIAEFLVSKGASVNKSNAQGETPLTYAACAQHVALCTLLLDNGADINKTSFRGTPLRCCFGFGGNNTVITTTTPEQGYTLLGYLLQKGADVNKTGIHGMTPLSAAAAEGGVKACELLLQHHASIDGGDASGWNPLLSATSRCDADVVAFLLDRGADVDHCDRRGQTAVHHICSVAAHEPYLSPLLTSASALLDMLLSHKAKVTTYDASHNTPLHYAAQSFAALPMCTALLAHGAAALAENGEHRTAFATLQYVRGRSEAKALLKNAEETEGGKPKPAPAPFRFGGTSHLNTASAVPFGLCLTRKKPAVKVTAQTAEGQEGAANVAHITTASTQPAALPAKRRVRAVGGGGDADGSVTEGAQNTAGRGGGGGSRRGRGKGGKGRGRA